MADRLRRHLCVAGIVCAILLAVCAMTSSSASADVSHAYSHSIGAASSSPANPYPIGNPFDIAVDQANGDVYVTDSTNHRVEKFDSAGNFLLMFGKDVNQTTGGDVCTAVSGNTCVAGTSSSNSGGFQSPKYLAIDRYPGGNGDVYVGDGGNNLVQKFTSSGQVVTSWGNTGQKDGSDALDLPVYGPLFGLAVGGPDGDLYVGGLHYSDNVWQYTRAGVYEGPYQNAGGTPWLKADSVGNIYHVGAGGLFGPPVVTLSVLRANVHGLYDNYQLGKDTPVTGFDRDPTTGEVYQSNGTVVDHYSSDCNPPVSGPCDPADVFGAGHLAEANGVGVDGNTHVVYVVNSATNDVAVFADVRPVVTTEAPTGATDTSVTLNGTIDPAGRGDITECRFEYGFDKTYGTTLPCTPDPASSPPGSHFTGPTHVTAVVTGLSPATTDHFRVVAANDAEGSASGVDRTFTTTSAPAITGLAAEHLTATTADLIAEIAPNGRETSYRFEYGPTNDYGHVAPVPDDTLPADFEGHHVEVHLEGLTPQVVYHYRLTAENGSGTTTVEDHTFNFYPPSCPNENVRQQTQANFLPDCRAYELVSPADAGGTQLYPTGPNTGYATAPPRFSFTGLFAEIPDSGGHPIDGSGDLYVSTRTDAGWVSRYVGWPSNEAAVDGGPPMGPPGSTPGGIRDASQMAANGGHGVTSQNGVITDLGMNRFLSFNDGNQSISSIFGADFQNRTTIASNAPIVFGADGTRLDRWPTNLGTVPDGTYPPGSYIYPRGGYPDPGEEPPSVAPGGIRSMNCPTHFSGSGELGASFCPGDVTASADLGHFVFAAIWNVFAPGGQLSAPGSIYDNETESGTVTVASKTPGGDDIPAEPADKSGTPLQIPDVSNDGSHILIAAGGTGPCGFSTCPTPPCGADYSATKRCQMQPSHLYMRVDGAITYDVSKGHYVDFVGTNDAATTVYFLSDEQLTGGDHDTSTDLYAWTQATDSLTLVSVPDGGSGPGEAGNTDSCDGGLGTAHGGFTTKCGVATYTGWYFCQAENPGGLSYDPGRGNCISDNSIAGQSGDIYFYSQELLDGSRGIPNQANLYVYRHGSVKYVTTLTGDPTCFNSYSVNGMCTRITRMQVAADGRYMAFITRSPVTQYDSAGFEEMYRYTPDTAEMVCVSCLPSGDKPTTDALASQDGLFMTNDGRTFFATEDPLVHSDTNKAQDVYEYVEGRPQLITLGTGDTRAPKGGFGTQSSPGLIAVSANGQDVYFSTFDTLARQDHNGLFLKFYDARSGGGFSAPAPPPPCEAADECHGPASETPAPIAKGTGGALGSGGNAVTGSTRGKGKKKPRRHHGKRSKKKSHSGRVVR